MRNEFNTQNTKKKKKIGRDRDRNHKRGNLTLQKKSRNSKIRNENRGK